MGLVELDASFTGAVSVEVVVWFCGVEFFEDGGAESLVLKICLRNTVSFF